MRRLPLSSMGIAPREDARWRQACEDRGFDYHSIDGAYWVDDTFYALSLLEWQALQRATQTWKAMFEDATEELIAVGPCALSAIGIPDAWQRAVVRSWRAREPSLGWRWDTLWDGSHWRLLECNCSTWSGLLECVEPQRDWARDAGLHAPNTLLEDGQAWFAEHLSGAPLSAYALSTQRVEVATAQEVARWAGPSSRAVPLERLWRNGTTVEQTWGFKVAPWHWWFQRDPGHELPMGHAHWAMPLWTAMWHSKGFLAWVSELNQGEPTLIAADWSPLVGVGSPQQVRKPFWGAEGHGVERTGEKMAECVYQRFVDAPVEGKYPTIGAWCINGALSGLYMRECDGWKLDEWSRMLPYAVI